LPAQFPPSGPGRRFVRLALLALVCVWPFFANAAEPAEPVTLEMWGLVESRGYVGTFAAIRAFEQRHPNIRVLVGTPGGQGDLDPQKLITAIVSHTPPDLIWFGRHNLGLWAPRHAFLALDDRIRRDGIRLDDYYPGAIGESQWQGKTYALPWNVDSRVLYANMTLLRQQGFTRLPRTWDDLELMTRKLTRFNERLGRYDQLGFAPNYGNSWLCLYAWQLGADMLSADGRRALLTEPPVVQALDWMVKMTDLVGGAERVNAFTGSAQLEGIGDPFLSGRIAMQITGSYILDYLARLKPDLDFEVGPPPVPHAGDPPISWSGGFSWVIPADARHPDEAWEFIKWMNSEEAWIIQSEEQQRFAHRTAGPQALFVPFYHANRVLNEKIVARYMPALPERFRRANQTCLDILPACKYRPVTPACSELWDAQTNAILDATFHIQPSIATLRLQQKRVQSLLDRIFEPVGVHTLSARRLTSCVIGIVLSLVAAGATLFFWRSRRYRPHDRRLALHGVAYASPWIIGFIVLGIGPMLYSLVMAFTRYDVISAPEFIGLGNFVRMFGLRHGETGALVANDPQFWTSLWNTFYMTLFSVPFGMVVSLGIALLLNSKVRGMTVYRTLYYVPVLVPAVAASFIFIWLLNPDSGLLNYVLSPLLHRFGMRAPNWFNDAHWAKPGLILLMTWGCGGTVIIWLAGLQSLPRHLYEAAIVDGAGFWLRFRHITLPLLSPYTLFIWIMGTIGSLQIFTQAYMIGAPGDAMLFNTVYLFFRAFRYFEMGYACAMAWVLFLITVVLCLWQLRIARRWVFYSSEF
jgi:multiple sugar transport system permease protein